MQKKLMGALAVAAVATLAASGAAMAAQPASKAKPATVVYQGVQVAMDPVTGRLRAPNAVERRALSKALVGNQARSVRPLDETQARATFRRDRRTGMMSMQVPESQVSHLAAHRTAEGQVRIEHEAPAADASSTTEVTP